uniref:Uncharacterized protein n=1 Tax=Cannabis sativa TaxID=3483 RepID=A0A803P2Y3_CANSA
MRTTSSFEEEDEQLPLYEMQMGDMAKKERARLKLAENAVHLIPLVLLFCAFILWFFSTTPLGYVLWNEICKDKNECGLDFKDIGLWNLSAISKHV